MKVGAGAPSGPVDRTCADLGTGTPPLAAPLATATTVSARYLSRPAGSQHARWFVLERPSWQFGLCSGLYSWWGQG